VLDENKKSEAIREQMLAVVSHDIKNPLSIIQLEAQMILKLTEKYDREGVQEKIKIQAKRILKTSERMKELISDLLDRHRVQDGLTAIYKTKCRFSELIRDVIDYNLPLMKQRSLSVDFESDFEEEVSLDSNKMVQVLSNLLSNAIKFSPPLGKIKIKLCQNDENLLFSISDQGPGIKDSELPFVFKKYWNGGISGCSELIASSISADIGSVYCSNLCIYIIIILRDRFAISTGLKLFNNKSTTYYKKVFKK
jgi:signal transduction histidine kinase